VRHDAHFDVRQLWVALDAIDERGTARRGGKQPLEHHQSRPVLHDRLKRLDGLRVRKREDLTIHLHALAERGHQVVRRNHQGRRRHAASLA